MLSKNGREHDALRAVLTRASVDREFRRQLLEDPRTAIERAFGIAIPADFRIKFIEREPGLDAVVVLPDFKESAGDAGELNDDQLDVVTGGTTAEEATWSDEVVPEELVDEADP
jgi:hypothetical protein